MVSPSVPFEVVDRIRVRITPSPDGCWLWPGATTQGYGRITYLEGGRRVWRLVHRVMYAATNGPIAESLDVDHRCHDPATCQPERAIDCPHRRCCNPAHLAAVTRRENLLRGGTTAANRAAVIQCPAGHAYTSDNTLTDALGRRSCKECTYERNRAYYHANKERRAAYNKAWREKRKREMFGD